MRLPAAAALLVFAPGLAFADEVVVDAGPRPALSPGARDETAASTVVRGEALRAPGGSVGDALRSLPGVAIQSTGSGSDLATAQVRGATSAQLPVYLAGIRLNDDLTGGADLSTVPTYLLEKAEIYRGNAPFDGDRMGIAGALFLEPRRPRRSEASVNLGVGSFGYRSAAGTLGFAGDHASVLAAVNVSRATNDYPYRDDNGTRFDPSDDGTRRRPNAGYGEVDLWSIGRVEAGDATITMLLAGFSREQGAPGQLLTPSLDARVGYRRVLAGLRSEMPCGNGCGFEIGTAMETSGTALRDPHRELGLGADRVDVVGYRVAPSARLHAALSDRWRVLGGVDLEHGILARRTSSTYPNVRNTDADRSGARGSAGVVFEPVAVVALSAFGAVDHEATEATGLPGSNLSPPSVRGSFRWGDARLALLANVSHAVRIPTLGELYGQSAVLGGNASLRPERGDGVDLGVRASQPFHAAKSACLAELDAFVYERRVADLVVYERDSFQTFRPVNIGDARLRGAEIAAALSFAKRLRLDENVTVLDAVNTTGGPGVFTGQLPFRARLQSGTTAAISFADIAHLPILSASARLVHISSRFADVAGLVVIPAQTTLDLDAAVGLPTAPIATTIRGRLANVTNAARFDAIGYPLPPRQAFVSVEAAY